MTMKKLIVGNWKMNGDLDLVNEFLISLCDTGAVIAFPCIFTAYACQQVKNKNIKIAAQDCSIYDGFGAHTGEISAKMLSEIGVEYVILGHSERRPNFSDDSVENICEKLKNVCKNNMTAILCIDEKYEELLDENTALLVQEYSFARGKCKIGPCCLDKIDQQRQYSEIILAYEPVSAIGTGKVPELSEIAATVKVLKQRFPGVRVLYGGSVNSSNVEEFLEMDCIDGLLIGGASLQKDEFLKICEHHDVGTEIVQGYAHT
jgi:triosephosphate isomerase